MQTEGIGPVDHSHGRIHPEKTESLFFQVTEQETVIRGDLENRPAALSDGSDRACKGLLIQPQGIARRAGVEIVVEEHCRRHELRQLTVSTDWACHHGKRQSRCRRGTFPEIIDRLLFAEIEDQFKTLVSAGETVARGHSIPRPVNFSASRSACCSSVRSAGVK